MDQPLDGGSLGVQRAQSGAVHDRRGAHEQVGGGGALSIGSGMPDGGAPLVTTARFAPKPLERHLLRARDLADARYAEPLSVTDLAAAAGYSPPYFSRAFRQAFGESPHQYLLTRRLERAAALLRTTDWPVARICHAVGWGSVGSFTTSFRRMHGRTPARYRAASPAAAVQLRIPRCVAMAYGRPHNRTFREDGVKPVP